MGQTINPFATADGPNYLAIFQQGRLNPGIPEQLDVIKRCLRAFEGTEQYEHFVKMYETRWDVQLKQKEAKEKTQPQSTTRPGELPLEEAMERTSDPNIVPKKYKLQKMNKKELLALAKENDIKTKNLKRTELIEALSQL